MTPAEVIAYCTLAVLSLLALAGLLVLGLYRGASWCVRSVAGWLRMRAVRRVLEERNSRFLPRDETKARLDALYKERIEPAIRAEARERERDAKDIARALAEALPDIAFGEFCDEPDCDEPVAIKNAGWCLRHVPRLDERSSEDAHDIAEAKRSRAEGGPLIPMEQVKKELGLDGATWKVTVDSTAAEWADSRPVTFTASNGTTSTTLSHEASMVESVMGNYPPSDSLDRPTGLAPLLCLRVGCYWTHAPGSVYCNEHARRST